MDSGDLWGKHLSNQAAREDAIRRNNDVTRIQMQCFSSL
jgi:hypothetical protein